MNTAMDVSSTQPGARCRGRSPRGIAPALLAALAAAILLAAPTVGAGPREQAKRMHDRLNGTAASQAVLDAMQVKVAAGDFVGAALLAIDNPNGNFYSVVLKNWVTPWTNRAQTMYAPLNDYTATVIGMVRDEVPFNTVLSADILYLGASGLGLPAYSPGSNAHYEALEAAGGNLGDPAVLMKAPTGQQPLTGIPAAATAGVMTTRAAARAFFVAGTNRAMFRFTMINYMCHDLEQIMDVSRPPDRIRQDVSRSPGGDSRVFLNNCVGCHSGMDPMAQAFAYYDYTFPAGADESTGTVVYGASGPGPGGTVAAKYFHNNTTFAAGFVTPDDSWQNRWRSGPNSLLGWDPARPGAGAGAKSLGDEIGASDVFAQCQVKKVFRAVCLRDPADATDRAEVSTVVGVFKANNYSLKRVFAETAAYCKGD